MNSFLTQQFYVWEFILDIGMYIAMVHICPQIKYIYLNKLTCYETLNNYSMCIEYFLSLCIYTHTHTHVCVCMNVCVCVYVYINFTFESNYRFIGKLSKMYGVPTYSLPPYLQDLSHYQHPEWYICYNRYTLAHCYHLKFIL